MATCDYDKDCFLVVEVYNRTLAKILIAERWIKSKAITPFSHFIFQEDRTHCDRLAKLFKEGRISVVINGTALDYEQIVNIWSYPNTGSPTPPAPGNRYYNQPVLGAINGVNTTFTSPTKFIHANPDTEMLRYNGVHLEQGGGNDYTVAESAPGTGYDIITTAFAPIAGDKLILDFTPHP